MTRQPAQPTTRHAPAFSLIEMLLVVSIVVIMAVLVFPMMIKVRENAQIQRTQMKLAALQTIAGAYKLETGNFLNLRDGTKPIDWTTDKTFNNPDPAFQSPNPNAGRIDTNDHKADSIERFVWACYQLKDLRKTIAAQDMVDLDNNGFLEIRDAWNNKLVYVDYLTHDGTTSSLEFLPEHGNAAEPKPFLVSAGPDGDFGDVTAASGTPQFEASEDNIISYDVEGVTTQ